MTDKPFQANDPAQVKKRETSQKLKLEQQREDMKKLLAMPEFRRFVWRHIHETCKLMHTPFHPNGSTQTLNIGMQDVARALWTEIEQIDAKVIPLMMTEYLEAA